MRFLSLQWAIHPQPPTPLPHCERGTSLEQVYRVVILSEACIAHIFCPLLNSHKGERGSLGALMTETGDRTQGLSKRLALQPL
jgi:hypothetical protein